jgi:hypothetical protein
LRESGGEVPVALWFVGIETKGKTLEEITGGASRATA